MWFLSCLGTLSLFAAIAILIPGLAQGDEDILFTLFIWTVLLIPIAWCLMMFYADWAQRAGLAFHAIFALTLLSLLIVIFVEPAI
ncbi:MAG: hypothetical protein AAF993_07230 [Pseudomonadota bacterium]